MGGESAPFTNLSPKVGFWRGYFPPIQSLGFTNLGASPIPTLPYLENNKAHQRDCLVVRPMVFTLALQISIALSPNSSIPFDKELPPIPSRALAQSKDYLANVLDVGFLLCLVRALPRPYLFAIHRQLDYGVVVGERLLIFMRLFLKLFLQ